jgi:putative transcriptional regulator
MKRNTTQATAFSKLKAGLEDAIAYHRGTRQLTVRDVELKPPAPMGAKEVLAVRARLRGSQAAFARILNVSPRTVQAWETNARARPMRRSSFSRSRRRTRRSSSARSTGRAVSPRADFDELLP